MSFTHLHVHSEYSLLRGMCKIKKLVQKVKDMGQTAVAITDFGAMYGAFKFFIACRDAGIKPIIGCEVYLSSGDSSKPQDREFADAYSLVLLAKNLEGYQNLIKIVSFAQLNNTSFQPRTDMNMLRQYSRGLIVMSGSVKDSLLTHYVEAGLSAKVQDLIGEFHRIWGDDYYITLERHANIVGNSQINEKLIKLARDNGVNLVASGNVHYLEKDDSEAHEVLLCIGQARVIFESDRKLTMYEYPDYYLKTTEEMVELYADVPEAITNTKVIEEKCDLEIPHGKLILPHFPIPDGFTNDSYLRHIVHERQNRTKKYPIDAVNSRLDYELEIISNKGYAPYFLFVQDVVNWAKDQGIAVGPGRGSAAGSLVAYVLRITDINPLDYNLPFERFLNPERPTPPDIDIDFADTRREEVVKYIARKYGEDKVAQIITFGTMESRMVVRDVSRALGHGFSTGDRIAKLIPVPKQGFHIGLAQAVLETPQLKLAYDGEEETKQIIDISKKLEGLPRHASVHAAGLIVGDKPLIERIPLQKEPKGNKIITQFDMYSLDLNAVSDNKAVGLVKADILGLRNLSIIESALNNVRMKTGVHIDIHEVNLDDKKAYDLIASGNTVGVFQLESGGMRRLARDLQANKLSDITAMVALYRPGPMDLIPTFIEGKRNPQSVSYPHDDLIPVLEETYGILVYQEQVIDIAVVMAHFSKSQADLLRMAVGKKKKALMEKGRIQFIEGCVKHGYSKKLAESIFGFIEKFAAYGFNKSHAASYALISYWTAYVKANYPLEFMTALLNAEVGGATGPMREVKMSTIFDECKRMGIKIAKCDIDYSTADFEIQEGIIRFGFTGIKNVGGAAIESITSARKGGPFTSFTDFLHRVDLRRVNKKTLESLILVGAFEKFGNRNTLLHGFPPIVEKVAKEKESASVGQFDLFGGESTVSNLKDDFTSLDELTDGEIATHERELIGICFTKSPLERFKAVIESKVNKKFAELHPQDEGKQFIFAGIITGVKNVKTKKDAKDMAIITINDDTGVSEAVVFPKKYDSLKDSIKLNAPLLLRATVTNREGALGLMVDNAINLELANIK